MSRFRGRQFELYDADCIFEELIPQDSFYRTFGEIIARLIKEK
jgi:hypothetical protein